MARALIAVATALVLLLAGLGLAVYFTRDEDYIAVDNLLAERLTRAIGTAQQGDGTVDLVALAPFAWDHVLIAQPGIEPGQISRRLGYPWKGRGGVGQGELLIFLRGGKVVRFADHRGEGRFAGFPRPFAELPRDRAVLRVRDLVIRPAR
jgi:hypothetical protein